VIIGLVIILAASLAFAVDGSVHRLGLIASRRAVAHG
jgi:hypothetical protein